jgi:hypothetical protein
MTLSSIKTEVTDFQNFLQIQTPSDEIDALTLALDSPRLDLISELVRSCMTSPSFATLRSDSSHRITPIRSCMSPTSLEAAQRATPIRVYNLCDSPFLNCVLEQSPSPFDNESAKWSIFCGQIDSEQINDCLLQTLLEELIKADGKLSEISSGLLKALEESPATMLELDISKYFDIESDSPNINECITHLTTLFPDIISFVLKNHPLLSENILETLSKWVNLQSLDLSGSIKIFKTAPKILESNFPNLTQLILSNEPSVSTALLLDEYEFECIDDYCMPFICSKLALNTLDISYSKITSQSAILLANLTQLSYLNLSYCTGLNDSNLSFLLGLKFLNEIDLTGVSLTEEALENLGKCPRLKKIHLSLKNLSNPIFAKNFLATHPKIQLCVDSDEQENLNRFKHELEVAAQRVSIKPKSSIKIEGDALGEF